MGRNRYLVSYDVSNEKRLRRMFTTMRGFGDAFHYSIFLCDLSAKERVFMVGAIKEVINQKEDRVFIADMGPVEGRGSDCIQVLGNMSLPDKLEAIVV